MKITPLTVAMAAIIIGSVAVVVKTNAEKNNIGINPPPFPVLAKSFLGDAALKIFHARKALRFGF